MCPKIVDHDRRRDELARRSWPAFAANGYERVTTRELARAIGISPGALYHYFPTKQELFEHTIRIMAVDDAARIERFPRPEDSAQRTRLLLAFLEKNEERIRSLLFLLFDYLRSASGKAASDLYEESLGRYSEALAGYLELDDPLLTEALMMYGDGLIMRRSFMVDTPPLGAHATRSASAVSAALAAAWAGAGGKLPEE